MPVGTQSREELEVTAAGLMLIINTITGWSFPHEEKLRAVLTEQFTRTLQEKYASMNSEEIAYAFRNDTTVQDWGKDMNLVLIDAVLRPYLKIRQDIQRFAESTPIALEMPKAAPFEMSDKEMIDMSYGIYKTLHNWRTILPKCYCALVRDGKMDLTDKQKADINKIVKEKLTKEYGAEHVTREMLQDNNRRYSVSLLFNEWLAKEKE